MKTLDAIKKLNAVKKEDGELLLAEPIDMKVLKGAKEQELAEAFMNAVETISDEDVDKYLPDDLSDIYNAFSDAEKTRTAETTLEKKPEKKPAAKASEKKKNGGKAESKSGEVKLSCSKTVAEFIKSNKVVLAELVEAMGEKGIDEKKVKKYVRRWQNKRKVPFGKEALVENPKTHTLSFA
jgi:uncharacterized protein YktA (UPF0223 family)